MSCSPVRTNPALWERVKSQVKREATAGTKAGQWSARKALLAVKRYKSAGGAYRGPKSKCNSLSKWVKQDWRTASGKPSHVTGERYLPAKAFKSLSKQELKTINASKKRAFKEGRQFDRMPKSISRKLRKFRQ